MSFLQPIKSFIGLSNIQTDKVKNESKERERKIAPLSSFSLCSLLDKSRVPTGVISLQLNQSGTPAARSSPPALTPHISAWRTPLAPVAGSTAGAQLGVELQDQSDNRGIRCRGDLHDEERRGGGGGGAERFAERRPCGEETLRLMRLRVMGDRTRKWGQ